MINWSSASCAAPACAPRFSVSNERLLVLRLERGNLIQYSISLTRVTLLKRQRVCERLVAIRFLRSNSTWGAACRLHRRRGDPLRFQREGKLKLTTATRSQTVATGIPEGFRSLGPRRVAPGGAEVGGYPRADCFRGPFGGGASLLRVQMTRADD